MRTFISLWFVAVVLFLLSFPVWSRDLNGEYKDSPLHAWFDTLKSSRGLCCSFADGHMVEPDDIDSQGDHYRVRIEGQWVDVPNEALVTVPNKFGSPVVWPYKEYDEQGNPHWEIRCFMPGAEG